MSDELLLGWKDIKRFTGAGTKSLKAAIKSNNLPIKYPFGRPQMSKSSYLAWLNNYHKK